MRDTAPATTSRRVLPSEGPADLLITGASDGDARVVLTMVEGAAVHADPALEW